MEDIANAEAEHVVVDTVEWESGLNPLTFQSHHTLAISDILV